MAVLPAQFLANEPAFKTGRILSGLRAQQGLERLPGVLFSRRVATGDAKDVPNDWLTTRFWKGSTCSN
jgi:hypothetical protein